MDRGIPKLFPVADPSGCPLVVPRLNDGSCYYLFILSLPFGSFAPQGSGSSKAKVTWDRTLVGDTRRWGLRVSKIRVLLPMCILKLTGSWEIGQSNGNLGQWVRVVFMEHWANGLSLTLPNQTLLKLMVAIESEQAGQVTVKTSHLTYKQGQTKRNKLLLIAVQDLLFENTWYFPCNFHLFSVILSVFWRFNNKFLTKL